MRMTRVLLLAVLVAIVPRPAYASFWDIIWQMSGPQLLGFGLQCETVLSLKELPDCALLGVQLVRDDQQTRLARESERRLWWIVEGRVYFSTGKNATENGNVSDFTFGRARMVGLDPMLAGRWSADRPKGWLLHWGVGASLNRLFGPDFDSFNNYAIKLRPFGADRKFKKVTFGAAYNLRLYPDGFDSEGGVNPIVSKGSEFERVHGVLIELRF